MKKQLIDADALIRFMNERHKTLVDERGWYDHYTSGYEDAITDVEEAPVVDAVAVVHGRWIERPSTVKYCSHSECSVCGSWQGERWMNYCPHCGAKMDAKEEKQG